MPKRRKQDEDAPNYETSNEISHIRNIIEDRDRDRIVTNINTRRYINGYWYRHSVNAQDEFHQLRQEQLNAELVRLQHTEHSTLVNEDLIQDINRLIYNLKKKPMTVSSEKLEELGKILFALIDYLGLKVNVEIIHDNTCTDSRCADPLCGSTKKWHISKKLKEFDEKTDRVDDLIIIGEEEE